MRIFAARFTDFRVKRRRGVLPLALALLGVATATVWAAVPAKRARPPKFNRSITDAFFADAREKLVGTRPDKIASSSAPAGRQASPADLSSPAASTAGSGWSRWIASEVVEDEIKAQQIKLAATVQNSTKFKGGDYQQARLHLSTLAMLFAIDAVYGEKMRWQREAPAARDLLARAGFNCKVGTDASYKEAKLRSDDLAGLVRGGTLQQPASTTEPSWAKVSDRAPLMKRLEQSHEQGLKPWSASQAEFSRNADKLSHEAQLVAALAEVIQRDGYEFADDESYREYARAMQAQALIVREAVEQKNFDQARKAVGEIGKACASCHEGFRS